MLAQLVERRAPHWWAEATAAPPAAWATIYARAQRVLGRADAGLTDAERAGIDWPFQPTLDELGRMALLAHARSDALALQIHRTGDNAERQALLRALPFLPRTAELDRIAVDACRTNVVPVFAAIACDNPHPAATFPELHFNQLVLKAVFVGLPLARVVGLARRRSPELQRMATDYAAERRAAGRPVPGDLALIGGIP